MAASLPVHPLATPCRTRIGGTFAFIFQVKIAAVISIVPAINPPHKTPKRGFTVPPSRPLRPPFILTYSVDLSYLREFLPHHGTQRILSVATSGGSHESSRRLFCFACSCASYL